MYQRLNYRNFVFFFSNQGVEVQVSEEINNVLYNLICYCDNPQAAIRILI